MTPSISTLPRLGIGDARRLFGMTSRALRFYEDVGLVTARRDRHNVRYYDDEARKRLGWISLLRNAGVSLLEVRHVLEVADQGVAAHDRALRLLQERRRAVEIELTLIDVAALKLKEERQRAEAVSPRLVRAR